VTLGGFREGFPEFANIPDELVQAKLNQAATSVSATIWGSSYDAGHGYLAAHLLATSPLGQDARLSAEKESTTYGAEFHRRLKAATVGIRCL